MTVLLLIQLSLTAHSNSRIQPDKIYRVSAPDDSKGKFTLINSSMSFSHFKIPENSFLHHYANAEFPEIDAIIKVIQTSLTKSIVIGKEGEKLSFAEMDIDANTLTVKSTFMIGKKETIKLILVRGGKLYIYSSFYFKPIPGSSGKSNITVIEREFDAGSFMHAKTKILMNAYPKEELVISDIIPDNPIIIPPPPPQAFVWNYDMSIKNDSDYMTPSEDSSRVIISYNVSDYYKGNYLFVCEHVLNTDAVNIYSFMASPDVLTNDPDVTSAGSTIVIEKVFLNSHEEYLSNRTYFINEGKVDSIDYTFAPLLKGVKDPDEITFDIDTKGIINKGETIDLLFHIRREGKKTIGIAKAELDLKQKKAISLNFFNFDKDFRKKYKIDDEVDGYITNATGYAPNGDLMICIEKAYDSRSTPAKGFKERKVGTYCKDHYIFSYSKDMNCKWVYANQKRKVESQTFSYKNCYSTAEYTKSGIFVTTLNSEKENGLWIYQLDPENGNVVKSEMPIDFTGPSVFPTNCLNNFGGKYYIVAPTDSPKELQIFTRK